MKRERQSGEGARRKSSRREFIKQSGVAAAGSALAGLVLPPVHAAEDHTIRLALIGCGGRGTGAVRDALSVSGEPVELHVMADLIESRLDQSHQVLRQQFDSKINVPPDRRFVGFDAYRKAIDSLRPGDVAMLTGYAAWRPVQLEYAVKKGVHVFMEKSFACDPPGVQRMIKAGQEAEKKNLKIAAGLMCRHSRNRQELIRRIRDGALGDLQLIRVYRMQPVGPLDPKPAGENELLWQVRNFFRFFWVSGGLFAEMTIHQIDEICWLKDAYPVSAHGIGGRAPSSIDTSQNLDSYAIEYTFADGTKATVGVRYLRNCHDEFATYVHGTKCAAQFSGDTHVGTVRIFKDQRIARNNIDWEAEKEKLTPWEAEWQALLDAIRHDRPHNEARRAALSNLADIMGRAAVHSGKIITWDEAMASSFQWSANVDQMGYDTPPPLLPDAQGRYPVPSPGEWTEI